MNYIINPEEIKLEIREKKPTIWRGSVVTMYTVGAIHLPTYELHVSNGHMSVYDAAEEAVEGLQKKVYFNRVHNNEHNKHKFMEEI